MARRPHRDHSPSFKAKGAVVAIKGEKTPIELAQYVDIRPSQITAWRDQLPEGATLLGPRSTHSGTMFSSRLGHFYPAGPAGHLPWAPLRSHS